MRWFGKLAVVFVVMLLSERSLLAATVYPLPSCDEASKVFAIRANGKIVPVVDYSKQYDYAAFSQDGSCSIEVVRLDGKPIEKFEISPLREKIAGRSAGSTLSFNISKPLYLIVEIDKLRRLVIAVDPSETNQPSSTGSSIYNITSAKYKADATGKSSSTAAIQKAIDDAANDPGKHGIVYVPSGVFVATNII